MLRGQQAYIDERESARQESIEKTALGRILTAYGRNKAALRRMIGDNYTLSWLWEEHPDAPVRLIAKHIYKWSFTDLFQRFTKTPILEAFEDAVDSFSEDRCYVGAVFHANVLGEMVIHNWPMEFPGTKIIPPCPVKEYGTLTIQPFSHFLKVYAAYWHPTGFPFGDQ